LRPVHLLGAVRTRFFGLGRATLRQHGEAYASFIRQREVLRTQRPNEQRLTPAARGQEGDAALQDERVVAHREVEQGVRQGGEVVLELQVVHGARTDGDAERVLRAPRAEHRNLEVDQHIDVHRARDTVEYVPVDDASLRLCGGRR